MKKVIIIAVVAALVLSLGVAAYAANNNRTSQPETTQSEQFSAEAPQMDGEKPSDLPEMLEIYNYEVKNGTATFEVLDTTSKWFGVTYAEDRQGVVDKIAELVKEGVYPAKLFA